jgi:bifunctional non-homologous end joining protein LigD
VNSAAGEREPLPPWVRPMLASAGRFPPDAGAWAYELKWDGVRASAYIQGGRLLRLLSRTGRDIAVAYPELRGLGPAVRAGQLALDGEIVAFEDGRPSFEALQDRIHVSSAAQAGRLAALRPVAFMVFDLLHLDGLATMEVPYQVRRELLEDLELTGQWWQTPPAFTALTGAELLQVAEQQGLEGVVAKRLTSSYQPGARSSDWCKVKHVLCQEAVVGGINPGKGARAGLVGSLLMGVQTAGGLAYAGRVGTGFTGQSLRFLGQRLAPLRRSASPFAAPVPPEHARGAVWVDPVLVIEVEFAGWTREGRMRAASYRGLRADKDPADVVREP